MKLLRNPDVRLGSWAMAALAILSCGFAWVRWGMDAAVFLLLLCALFYSIFLGAAAWRYRRIRTMGEAARQSFWTAARRGNWESWKARFRK